MHPKNTVIHCDCLELDATRPLNPAKPGLGTYTTLFSVEFRILRA